MRFFRLDDPQSWQARPALPMAYDATMGFVAADRERVYWAHESSGWCIERGARAATRPS